MSSLQDGKLLWHAGKLSCLDANFAWPKLTGYLTGKVPRLPRKLQTA